MLELTSKSYGCAKEDSVRLRAIAEYIDSFRKAN